MPAASWIGLSATTICIVEQLGLATMPRWPSSASGLTSATTSGTSSFMRQKDELSTTTAPASANCGAHSSLTPEPAEKSARSKPWIASSRQRLHGRGRVAVVDLAPGRALGGERHDLVGGEAALAHDAEHAWCPRRRWRRRRRPSCAGLRAGRSAGAPATSSGLTASAPSSNAGCSSRTAVRHVLLAHHAGDLDRRGRDHLDVHARVAERAEASWPRRPGGSSFPRRPPRPSPSARRSAIVAEAELRLERLERRAGGGAGRRAGR